MDISKQVCTLKQAKRLKDLGIEQKSIFYHVFSFIHKEWMICQPIDFYLGKDEERYSAFTVAELGIMIGKGTVASEKHWQWLLDSVNSGLSATTCYNAETLTEFVITQITEGCLPVEEVNNRLINS